MAQITHGTRTTPAPYKHRGGTWDMRSFQASTVAASSGTIRYGDVVQFDVTAATANFKVIKSSTMANAPNVLSTAFLGIAAEADSGSPSSAAQGSSVVVIMATKDAVFKWPTKATGAQHASSLVGVRKAIEYDSTLSMFYVDVVTSTVGDASVVITEVIDPGTTNGFVAAKFLSTSVARLISAAF